MRKIRHTHGPRKHVWACCLLPDWPLQEGKTQVCWVFFHFLLEGGLAVSFCTSLRSLHVTKDGI